LGENDFSTAFSSYLYIGAKSKLVLNNDIADFYFDLISIRMKITLENN